MNIMIEARRTIASADRMRGRVTFDGGHCCIERLTYFVQGEMTGLIQIGKGVRPECRVRDLQGASPDKLKLLGITRRYSKSGLHHRFRHLRAHNEWFRPEPELLNFIYRVAVKPHVGTAA
jgi:hypothetical protein